MACLIDYEFRISVCHHGGDYISPCSIPTPQRYTAPRLKTLAPSNENDYHLHIWGLGEPNAGVRKVTATGGMMRTRQDIWLNWATGILVALGIVAIAAGSVLIAWMSLHPI
jgi:hypothetical protein